LSLLVHNLRCVRHLLEGYIMCITYVLNNRKCSVYVADLSKLADVIADLLIAGTEIVSVK